MISDVDIIIEKYDNGGKYFNVLNDFISKSFKIFNTNPELLLQFRSVVDFFRNDLFILQKISHIFECIGQQNVIFLNNLSFLVEDKLAKIIGKLREDVFLPFNEMNNIFEQKEEMNYESYLIQISNIFEFNQRKIKNALESVLKVGKNSDGNSNDSFDFLIQTFKNIKKEFLD